MRRSKRYLGGRRSISLFAVGQILVSTAASEVLRNSLTDANELVRRHSHGDWRGLDETDQRQNRLGVSSGRRVLSNFDIELRDGTVETVLVLTSGDRLWTRLDLAREIFDATSEAVKKQLPETASATNTPRKLVSIGHDELLLAASKFFELRADLFERLKKL